MGRQPTWWACLGSCAGCAKFIVGVWWCLLMAEALPETPLSPPKGLSKAPPGGCGRTFAAGDGTLPLLDAFEGLRQRPATPVHNAGSRSRRDVQQVGTPHTLAGARTHGLE